MAHPDQELCRRSAAPCPRAPGRQRRAGQRKPAGDGQPIPPADGDVSVAPALVGAKTLYRLSRNADGSLRANDDTSGWIEAAG